MNRIITRMLTAGAATTAVAAGVLIPAGSAQATTQTDFDIDSVISSIFEGQSPAADMLGVQGGNDGMAQPAAFQDDPPGDGSGHRGAARNGVCDAGEFCYYYNTDYYGAISDFTESVDQYGSSQPGCFEFRNGADIPGGGQCIKNNAAAVWNNSNRTVTVYENSGFGGRALTLKPGEYTNLIHHGLKNNQASHRFH